jgi:hypothetical protein
LLIFELEVEPLVRGQRRVGSVRGGEAQAVQKERVREVEAEAYRAVVPVALEHRVDGLDADALEAAVVALLDLMLLEVDIGRRAHIPLLDDGVLLDDLVAEEGDRGHVLERLGVDDSRHEPVTGVAKDDQRAVLERNRPEETGLGVAHRLDLVRRQLVAEDVGGAGELGAAE